MVDEIVVKDKSYYTVLENYVVGIMRGLNENSNLFGDGVGTVEYVDHMGSES